MELEATLRIFLLGIDPSFSKKALLNYFKQKYPSVTNCCLIKKDNFKNKTKNSGCGTLFLKNPIEAEEILKKENFTLKGRRFVVKPYFKGKKLKVFKESVKNRRLYISKIDPRLNNDRLKEIFEEFGEVEDAYIVRNKNYEGFRKFGYVVFKLERIAQLVVKKNIIDYEYGKLSIKKFNEFNKKNEKLKISKEKQNKNFLKKRVQTKNSDLKEQTVPTKENQEGSSEHQKAHRKIGYCPKEVKLPIKNIQRSLEEILQNLTESLEQFAQLQDHKYPNIRYN